MLPTGKTFTKDESKSYPPIPENIYLTELLDIELQEKPDYNDKSKIQEVLSFQFTILEEQYRTRNLWLNYVPTHLFISKKTGKNKLYKAVEALIKRELTNEEEAKGISSEFLNSLIGQQCKIFVEVKSVGDKEFNNILKLMPADVSGAPLTAEERDKCKVKKKDDKQNEQTNEPEIDVSQIPF